MRIYKIMLLVTMAWMGLLEAMPIEERHHRHHNDHRCHHQNKRIKHMRDKIDRMELRQKTDHLRITFLEDSLVEIKEDIKKMMVRREAADGKHSRYRKKEVNDHRHLSRGSEKYPAATKVEQSSSLRIPDEESIAEKTALHWVVEILPKLQQNIEELQVSTHLAEKMQKQQERESKLTTLRNDVNLLSQTLTKVTSVTESTDIRINDLRNDLESYSTEMKNVQAKMMIVEEKVNEQSESFDDLLKALPDGLLAHYQINQVGNVSNPSDFLWQTSSNSPPDGTQQDTQQPKADDTQLSSFSHLDAAQSHIPSGRQREDESNQPATGRPATATAHPHIRSAIPDLKDTGDKTQKALRKIRHASVSLLNIISDVEKRQERSIAHLREDLSKVEANVEKESEDQTVQKEKLKDDEQDLGNLRHDITMVQHSIRNLEEELVNINDNVSKMEPEKNVSEKELFDRRIEDLEKRLIRIENTHQTKPKHRRHKHG